MAKATKTIANFEAKGWTRLDLVAGQSVDIAYDPTSQDLAFNRGQVFAADGSRLKGRSRPKFSVAETDTGATVSSSVDATVLYKIQEETDEDEADDDAPVATPF